MSSSDNLLKRVSPDTKIRTRSGAFLNSPEDLEPCPLCQETQLALVMAQEQNEYLMRGFGGIFTQIDSAKDFVKTIEEICRQHERIPDHIHDISKDVYIIDPAEIAAKRSSRHMSHDVVDQMFPKGLEVSDVEHQLNQLDNCLTKMRELCMSFANSCFEGGTALTKKIRPPLKRVHTVHSSSFSQTLDLSSSLDEGSSSRPLLSHNYSEHSPRQTSPSPLRRTHSETELNNVLSISTSFSADPLTMSTSPGPRSPPPSSSNNNYRISYPSGSMSKNLTPKYDRIISSPGGRPAPFRSHLMSVLNKQQTFDSTTMSSLSNSTIFLGTLRSATLERKTELEAGAPSLEEGLTGLESVQLFDKITTLEQERLSFVTKNEELNNQNKALWLAISEMGQDLDRKYLELHLLKADIKKATTLLKLAAEHKDELAELKRERDRLRDKSTSLEDEGRLVKDSLVNRLTQMAATSKVLSLDNQRLRNKIVQLRSSTAPPLSNQSSAADLKVADYEDEEGRVVIVGGADEIQLQGALMELDDSGGYVHKQGFLVKQGHKRKSWKRRMFVLDTHALSYFKTEEPLDTLPLSEIHKVQIAQGQTSKPNMFEIHRLDGKKYSRVYYLSAPSQEEMESWIGIIQTLKDTRERTTRSPHPGTVTTTTTSQQQQGYPSPVLQSLHKNRSHTTLHGAPLTMPRVDSSWESSSHLRVDDSNRGGGVRNRMFTEGGQRRLDLVHLSAMDTSDEEEIDRDVRSPFPGTVSSDDEGGFRGEQILLTTLQKK